MQRKEEVVSTKIFLPELFEYERTHMTEQRLTVLQRIHLAFMLVDETIKSIQIDSCYPECIGLHGLVVSKSGDQITNVIIGSRSIPADEMKNTLAPYIIESTDQQIDEKSVVQMLGFLFLKLFRFDTGVIPENRNTLLEQLINQVVVTTTNGFDRGISEQSQLYLSRDLTNVRIGNQTIPLEVISYSQRRLLMANHNLVDGINHFPFYKLSELEYDYTCLGNSTISRLDDDSVCKLMSTIISMVSVNPENRPDLTSVKQALLDIFLSSKMLESNLRDELSLLIGNLKARRMQAIRDAQQKSSLLPASGKRDPQGMQKVADVSADVANNQRKARKFGIFSCISRSKSQSESDVSKQMRNKK